jgi:hypothetical protein
MKGVVAPSSPTRLRAPNTTHRKVPEQFRASLWLPTHDPHERLMCQHYECELEFPAQEAFLYPIHYIAPDPNGRPQVMGPTISAFCSLEHLLVMAVPCEAFFGPGDFKNLRVYFH